MAFNLRQGLVVHTMPCFFMWVYCGYYRLRRIIPVKILPELMPMRRAEK